jgi:SAM-dependent methyltransferase
MNLTNSEGRLRKRAHPVSRVHLEWRTDTSERGTEPYLRRCPTLPVPRAVPPRVQKRVFGRNPEAYDRARLTYPKEVYAVLTTRCGLRPGTAVFEIGPGTGKATRELLKLGADPITLIEPDPRLARFLRQRLRAREGRVRIVVKPFERVALPRHGFDLGVAATSFHWLPERLALRKVARLLKSGGWWAAWNNYHGDPDRPTSFHRALQPLYRELFGQTELLPSKSRVRKSRRNRLLALESLGTFERIAREDIRWTVTLRTPRVQALWASFSEIVTLSPRKRDRFLAELGRLVDGRFDGRVEIPMLTPVYTARRI